MLNQDNATRASVIGALLTDRQLTFSAAESCTGGLLLSTLTDVPGSSAYVIGGVVAYSNAAKMQLVSVQEATLMAHGAVSQPTAHEMVVGVKALFSTDVAISITGIAGPGGGTETKPVGLTYIGVAYGDHVRVARYVWPHDRAGNKDASVGAALALIAAIVD